MALRVASCSINLSGRQRISAIWYFFTVSLILAATDFCALSIFASSVSIADIFFSIASRCSRRVCTLSWSLSGVKPDNSLQIFWYSAFNFWYLSELCIVCWSIGFISSSNTFSNQRRTSVGIFSTIVFPVGISLAISFSRAINSAFG